MPHRMRQATREHSVASLLRWTGSSAPDRFNVGDKLERRYGRGGPWLREVSSGRIGVFKPPPQSGSYSDSSAVGHSKKPQPQAATNQQTGNGTRTPTWGAKVGPSDTSPCPIRRKDCKLRETPTKPQCQPHAPDDRDDDRLRFPCRTASRFRSRSLVLSWETPIPPREGGGVRNPALAGENGPRDVTTECVGEF